MQLQCGEKRGMLSNGNASGWNIGIISYDVVCAQRDEDAESTNSFEETRIVLCVRGTVRDLFACSASIPIVIGVNGASSLRRVPNRT